MPAVSEPGVRGLEPRGPLPGGRRQLHLVGFMGCGKSTVGRLLARRWAWSFLDLDVLVERHAGRTIAAIFAEGGETAFREAEAHVLRQAVQKPATVLALGGGTFASAANRRVAAAAGLSVWIDCPFEVLQARVGPDARSRPLWGDPESAAALWRARCASYRDADLRVGGAGAPEEVATRIEATIAEADK